MEDEEIEEGMLVEEDVQTDVQGKVEKSAYEMLQESKASVEEIVAEMLSIKREGKPKSELRELVTQMFIHFVSLRQVLFILSLYIYHSRASSSSLYWSLIILSFGLESNS